MTRLLSLSLWFLLLSGCALSPQQVLISPQVTPTQTLQGAPRVQVTVVDQRPRDIIGTRGGIYGDTSFVRPGNDLKQALASQAETALAAMGARPGPAAADSTRITLYLETLDYSVKTQGVFKDINLQCHMRAVAEQGGRRHEGRFVSNRTHRFVKAPSDAENEAIINEIISETLGRAVNDSELASFIQRR